MKRNPLEHVTNVLLILILAAGLPACKSDKAIQGFDLVDPTGRGEVLKTTLDTLEVETTFKDTVSNSGSSALLLLGQFRNVATQILLKFDGIPDTVQITRVTLVLTSSSIVSDGAAKNSFFATVHPATADWEERKVTYDSFGQAFDPVPIGTAEVLPVASRLVGVDSTINDEVRFVFTDAGVDLVRQWADTTTGNNFGVLVDFETPLFIKEFFSRGSLSNQPKLELNVLNGTEQDTVIVSATEDAFIAKQLSDPPAGPLYVDNTFTHQTVLKFDLSRIPRESTINSASLKLHVDQQNSLLRETGTVFQLIRLSKPFEPPGTFRKDSSFVAIALSVSKSTDELSIPVRSLLQGWVIDLFENHGFVIQSANPGGDVNRVAFHSNATDPERAPKITVDFTTAPSSD